MPVPQRMSFEFSCGTGILPVPKLDMISCTIVKNGQDARSTKNDFSRFTGILPVPKQVIENGKISQLDATLSLVCSENSENRSILKLF
ncbi:hypothetical protein QUA56_32870 [Microcoleus sp. N3A4]|uniref:hypothetical protein n=1 Tax=Microcoleus sp. N3A4 TaxID=3055379 RepID=UPI002FD5064F